MTDPSYIDVFSILTSGVRHNNSAVEKVFLVLLLPPFSLRERKPSEVDTHTKE